MEAAGTVLEVLSVSFGTLQKAVAGRPREQAKRARSEQQMPVEAAGWVAVWWIFYFLLVLGGTHYMFSAF